MPTKAEARGAALDVVAWYRKAILRADQRIARAIAELDAGMEERDSLIVEALDHTALTQAIIADDLGVTQGRVSQLAKRQREKP